MINWSGTGRTGGRWWTSAVKRTMQNMTGGLSLYFIFYLSLKIMQSMTYALFYLLFIIFDLFRKTMQTITGGLFFRILHLFFLPHNFYIPTKLDQILKLGCHIRMNSFSCLGGITSSCCPTQRSAWCRGVGGLDHSASLRPCRCFRIGIE